MASLSLNRVLLAALGVSGVVSAMSACSASNATTPRGNAGHPGTAGVGAGATGGTLPGTAGAAGVGTAGTGTAGTGTAGTGTAGTGTAGGAGTGAAGTGAGGTGTAGSATTAGSAGTGGTTVTPMPLCTVKATASSTLIADFEGYDGTTAPASFSWIFGGATAGMLGVHSGTYGFGDCDHVAEPTCTSGVPVLAILAGHGGNYGLSEAVTAANRWGEGFGFYLLDTNYQPGCINASAYKGISMWVRGVVPTNTFSFSLSMAQATRPNTTTTPTSGGSCTGADDTTCKSPTKSDIPVSATWGQVNILWADLTGGLSGPAATLLANGDNITGMSFSAGLQFVPDADGSTNYVAVPGDVSLVVDDIAFIP